MEKIINLTDIELRKKTLFLRWSVFAIIVIAMAISAFVFLFTESLKIASVIPIILIPAFNLPVTLKLIKLDDERRRRYEKYEQLYSVVTKENDIHLMN